MRDDTAVIGISGLAHLADLIPLADNSAFPRGYFRKMTVYGSVAAGVQKFNIITHPAVKTGLNHLPAPDGEDRLANLGLQVYTIMLAGAASLGHKITAAIRIVADDYGILLIFNRTEKIRLVQIRQFAIQIIRQKQQKRNKYKIYYFLTHFI